MTESAECVCCGAPGASKWTISGDHGFTILWLCTAHEAPIREILAEAAKQVKKGASNVRGEAVPHSPAPRKKTVQPLNWTPPA